MLTGRSYMAGDRCFPVLFLLDRDNPGLGMGFRLDPVGGTVQPSIRKWGSWYEMASVDPRNGWRLYAVRYCGKSRRCSFFVDGEKVGDTERLQLYDLAPGSIWIASNPAGEARVWFAQITLTRE
jgi:hypothetical protein